MMNRLLLYILLLSYITALIKPVMPYVSDGINHVFFYAHHMATVHYENGKYHIHRDLLNNSKEESTDKHSAPQKSNNANDEHLVSAMIIASIQEFNFIRPIYFITVPRVPSGISRDHFPPPRRLV